MNFYEQIFSRGRATGEGMTHFERLFAAKFGGSPAPKVREYTGAVPVTITADGTPLIDLLISGNEEHTGTPTPDNPVMPQGTGERTANLYGGTDISGTINNRYYKNDFVYANIAQGTYTLAFDLTTTNLSSEVYASSIGVGETGYSKDIQQQSGKTDGHFVFTFTIEAEDAGKNLYARFARFGTAVTITYTASNIMLNTGSTALPYEPYGIKIPISSANTTTNVYLGEVQTTRQVKKLVLTGTEKYIKESNATYLYYVYVSHMYHTNCLCSHLKSTTGYPIKQEGCSAYNNAAIIYLNFGSTVMDAQTSGNTVAGLKEYLAAQYAAGTPVTIWYVLATEETGIVNEPLMKIGEYADTLSKAQAGVSIPTNNGSTTVDVDTTLKPSEVYIKYMG